MEWSSKKNWGFFEMKTIKNKTIGHFNYENNEITVHSTTNRNLIQNQNAFFYILTSKTQHYVSHIYAKRAQNLIFDYHLRRFVRTSISVL